LVGKKEEIKLLEKETERENFWQETQKARKAMQKLEILRNEVQKVTDMEAEIASLWEISQIAGEDIELKKEISQKVAEIEKKLEELELQTFFQGKYDRRNAILSIHSGTGGTDAQDWAEMLLRMYLRYAERKKWKAKIISETRGAEAGIKSVTAQIEGPLAYGHLRAEAGVHRLVRLSPFNANNLRQTSFALVEVLPEIDKIEEAEIKPAELRIDTFRAGGAGGQHVNKTSSAVRITHLPTGITATSQSERSQLQNKEAAMKILQAKLFQKRIEEKEQEKQKLKGKHAEVQWGSQIRSYILHPYKLVKDHCTKFESKNPEEVLDGKIDEFIEAYLRSK